MTTSVAESQLRDRNAALKEKLDSVREKLASKKKLSLSECGKALDEIRSRGKKFIHLFMRNKVDLDTFQNIFDRALRAAGHGLSRAGWDRGVRRIPWVEIRSRPEHCVPLEIMPVLDSRPMPSVDRPEDLAGLANRLPGFAMTVSRSIVGHGKSWSGPMRCAERLPVKFFCDRGIAGVDGEIDFLSSELADRIEFDGPWPDEEVRSDEFVADLWSHISDPRQRFAGGRLSSGSVMHFSCHYDAGGQFSEDYSISLGTKRNERSATLGELIDLSVDSGLRQVESRDLPLVFLNACGSASVSPSGVADVSDFFLSLGSGGVVGCVANVPVHFAAWFTKIFYDRFSSGQPLGRALYRARWQLLARKQNPLGVLYVAYANAQMEVTFDER